MNSLTKQAKALKVIKSNLEDNSVELVMTETVQDFLALKADLEAEIKATWNAIEAYMLAHGISQIGQLSIAERQVWDVDEDLLPARFFKKVPDTKKIANYYKVYDRPVKGVDRGMKQYLTKTNRKVEA